MASVLNQTDNGPTDRPTGCSSHVAGESVRKTCTGGRTAVFNISRVSATQHKANWMHASGTDGSLDSSNNSSESTMHRAIVSSFITLILVLNHAVLYTRDIMWLRYTSAPAADNKRIHRKTLGNCAFAAGCGQLQTLQSCVSSQHAASNSM